LPAATAFYNAATGKGTQARIFLNGEEGGSTGYALANVATGANKGNSFVLGKFNLSTNGSGLTGVGGWENLLANWYAQDKTVVIGDNDGGTGIMTGSVAVYVGTKTNTGSDADKAGLTNGLLKFVSVAGNVAEITDATTRATGITNGTRFSLSSTASTTFSRPEDGTWDPIDPTKFYFVTTDRLDQASDGTGTQIGQTRLWRLTFDDITNPDAGGKIDLLVDGDVVNGKKVNMFDNITIDKYGHILLQEDVGNAAHNGKIWQYDIATDSLKLLAQHDPARFGDVGVAATAPFTQDEETSGIIDLQDILGPGAFAFVDQAHYATDPATTVEGGQLMVMFNPDTYKSYQPDYINTPVSVNFAAGETSKDVTVPILGDRRPEGAETVSLALVNPSGAGIVGSVQPNATLRIADSSVGFNAVAAGNATVNQAILWTRTFDKIDSTGRTGVAESVVVEVATDETFGKLVYTATGATSADSDYSVKFKAEGLSANTTYSYRFKAQNGEISGVGRFRTLPDAAAAVAVHLGHSGDNDGLMRPYPLAAAIAAEKFDGFTWNGDTIYETGSTGSAATPATKDAESGAVSQSVILDAYRRKYLENVLPAPGGTYQGLKDFLAANGIVVSFDNHELGNKGLINGGAPFLLGTTNANGSANSAYDVNATGTYINDTKTFDTLLRAFTDYMPIEPERIVAPGDPRSDGELKFYGAQAWGKNALTINLDTRSFRDVRLNKAAGGDDTGARADNPGRTLLGATQKAWLKQTLLDAKANGTVWKFINITDPMDMIGAYGSGEDGGKSWWGGYRAERNEILKFIADNGIKNVVFIASDDHTVRLNELTYMPDPTKDPTNPANYKALDGVIHIVDGPFGATGPDTVTDHSFANVKALADALALKQRNAGLNPVGLDPSYRGLFNVYREGDPTAASAPKPFDFFSPDTFTYVSLDVAADGVLNVAMKGINSYAQNSFPEPAAAGQSRTILSFSVDPNPGAFVSAPGAGGNSVIQLRDVSGTLKKQFNAFPGFNGSVSVSYGDLNGDGVKDIVAGAGPGGGPHVKVFDGLSGNEIASFYAYDAKFSGGVNVAVGDLNGDGKLELITGAGAGGGPHVKAFALNFSGARATTQEVASFYAYDPSFRGGVSVAAGDVNGDGALDIITGAGAGGGPHVKAFGFGAPAPGLVAISELTSFYAYDANFRGGVNVASGNIDGIGADEIITGAGAGGGPHVKAFSRATDGAITTVSSFMAYDQSFRGGVDVGAMASTTPGFSAVLTGAGPGGGPHVRGFDLSNPLGQPREVLSLYADAPGFAGGVAVS